MTAPRMKQLFISYRSSDAIKVDKIARDLGLLQYDDGTPRYTTWQDKHNLPPASPSWWDSIVEAIESCDIFVFHMSRGSLQSTVCRAELDYAYRRHRAVISVVLDGEFFLDPISGKYDLPKDTWALVPDWLKQSQLIFYIPTEFYGRFQTAVEFLERNWPRDIPAPRPLNPDAKSGHSSNHALYSTACDYASRLAFTEADNYFSTLIRRNDGDYAELAELWLKVIRGYSELLEMVEHKSPTLVFNRKWTAYQQLFPNEIAELVFDPKGLEQRVVDQQDHLAGKKHEETKLNEQRQALITILAKFIYQKSETERLSRERSEAQRISQKKAEQESIKRQTAVKTTSTENKSSPLYKTLKMMDFVNTLTKFENLRSKQMLPRPFAWIPILTRKGKMQTNQPSINLDIPTEDYVISKYPVTNAQYAKFIEAGGYGKNKWWTDKGWDIRQKEKWTEPRFWQNVNFNRAEQPVIGISWYEAVAFCLWLSDETEENIMLPNEAQWQYAAQGNEGFKYPWGNDWDPACCNNKETGGFLSVFKSKPEGHGKYTTPVTAYKDKGESSFGVVDMSGNVQEWCVTDYEKQTDDFRTIATYRVLRGGSWSSGQDLTQTTYRFKDTPLARNQNNGFRLVLRDSRTGRSLLTK